MPVVQLLSNSGQRVIVAAYHPPVRPTFSRLPTGALCLRATKVKQLRLSLFLLVSFFPKWDTTPASPLWRPLAVFRCERWERRRREKAEQKRKEGT